ncbi:serine/threonine protein kinase [Archangium sp.]|uniref:serine/threonine protein kinase n=1 Tax=Archangium sp. TaxID=1872627 RepID=UPI00389B2A86
MLPESKASSGAPREGTCAVCGNAVTAERCEGCGSPVAPGGFRVLSRIAMSMHSRVYLAEGPEGSRVALKELVFRLAPDTQRLEAFRREGELLAQLSHPRIPRFLASFTEGTGPQTRLYLAQEFIEGPSLLKQLQTHRFTEGEVIAVGAQVLEILVYLHGLSPRVLHRDLKPANLLVRPDGSICLVDFGTARDVNRGGTVNSTLVGTFGYMAPEQLGGTVSESSDLYAVGATLLHLLSRRSPSELLRGKGLQLEVGEKLDASPGFSAFLQRLLAPSPADRFPTAAEALRALEALRRGEQPAEPAPARFWKPLALGSMGLSAVLLAALLWPTPPPPQPPPRIVEVIKEVPVPAAAPPPPPPRGVEVLVEPFNPEVVARLNSLGGCFKDTDLRVTRVSVARHPQELLPKLRFELVFTNRSPTQLCQWAPFFRLVDDEGTLIDPKLEEKVVLPLSSQVQEVTREISHAQGSFTVRLGLVQAPDAVYRIDLATQHATREQ